MKSRDEIVIIMLQWMRLYTLGSRGSRELKTFLEIRLISSRIDQKLVFKGRIYGFLNGNLTKKSWVVDAFVGAISWARGSDSFGQDCGFNPATNPLQFRFNRSHDRALIVATIKRRSSHDHEAIELRS